MTLILQGTDNSVSSPAVQGGTAGTTTGLYYPNTSQVALATNGSIALRIDSGQNTFLTGSYLSLNNNGYIRSDITNSLAFQAGSSSTLGFQVRNNGNGVAMLAMNGANQYSLALEGATPQSGVGITFPATQVSSANANTLDDYEEGTWTPTDASGSGLSFSVTGAYYRKIGTLVFINCYFTYPATSNTNQAGFGNLPFTASGAQNYSYIMGRTQNNLGNMVAWQVNSGSNSTAANFGWNSVGSVSNANLSGSYILVSGCYIADN